VEGVAVDFIRGVVGHRYHFTRERAMCWYCPLSSARCPMSDALWPLPRLRWR
jgi:hypothetical protein